MDKISGLIQDINIRAEIVVGIISIVLTLFVQHIIPRFFSGIILLLKNKYFSHESIIGDFYGYYLHKGIQKPEVILRESNWKISSDFKKGHFIVTIYHNEDLGKKRIIDYKGKMWVQGDHYLLQFDSQRYPETIFERRIQVTKTDDAPIVGISLAITTTARKIRANVSVLSKNKLAMEDFHRIVKAHKIILEKETYNLKVQI